MAFRILSVDGGGIRGAYAAHVLERIYTTFEIAFTRDFQLIAGTSTGAIIAAALAFEVPLSKVVQLYSEVGPQLFRPRYLSFGGKAFPKYSLSPLIDALDKVFENATLEQAKTRLVLPATDIANGTVHVFKSAYDDGFVRDRNVRVVDAIAASCSAPLYFAPMRVGPYQLCDGGLWANNPSLVGVIEAIGRLRISPTEIQLLSIGTGTSNTFYPIKGPHWKWGFALGWGVQKFIEMLLGLQSTTAHNTTKLLIGEEQIVRITFESDRRLPLDDATDLHDLRSRADRDYAHMSQRLEKWFPKRRAE